MKLHLDGPLKRQMFIKTWIRLLSLTVSRFRLVVEEHPTAVANTINGILQFISAQNTTNEYGSILTEYIQAMCSSSPIGDALQMTLCQWIETKMSAQLIQSVLGIVLSHRNHLNRIALVIETSLEHYDVPWPSAVTLMGLPLKDASCPFIQDLIVACIKQSCVLTWYCLLKSYDSNPADNNALICVIDQLLSGCKLLPLRYLFHMKHLSKKNSSQ